MEKKKLIVTLFPHKIENVHLIKDVGMIPYTFMKVFNYDCELVGFKDPDEERKDEQYKYLKKEVKGLKLVFLKGKSKIPFINIHTSAIIYIYKNAKKIDILNLFHFGLNNIVYGYIYKYINPKGKLYLKLDIKSETMHRNLSHNRNLNGIKSYLRKFFVERILDFASYENKLISEDINELIPEYKEKFIYIPNGININERNAVKEYSEKENLIITVGRIGSDVKNNELLLSSLSKVNLENWKVFFVGPIEESFQQNISKYFLENPNHLDKVTFTGNILDRDILFDYYNRAKVFCLTSKSEGFALVFPEAIYARNYIITTNVGGALDITEQGSIGCIVNKEVDIVNILEKVIGGEIDLEKNYYLAKKHSSNFIWNNIIENHRDKFR
jgi:glycosyltransferase involved in cell wall biosynthesis